MTPETVANAALAVSTGIGIMLVLISVAIGVRAMGVLLTSPRLHVWIGAACAIGAGAMDSLQVALLVAAASFATIALIEALVRVTPPKGMR